MGVCQLFSLSLMSQVIQTVPFIYFKNMTGQNLTYDYLDSRCYSDLSITCVISLRYLCQFFSKLLFGVRHIKRARQQMGWLFHMRESFHVCHPHWDGFCKLYQPRLKERTQWWLVAIGLRIIKRSGVARAVLQIPQSFSTCVSSIAQPKTLA